MRLHRRYADVETPIGPNRGWTPHNGANFPSLSSRDLMARPMPHPEHEVGETERGRTRHWVELDDFPVLVQPWHRDAECAKPKYATVDFFHNTYEVRAACDLCQVRDVCLEDALKHEREVRLAFGVRGGLGAHDRLQLIRRTERDDGEGLVYFGWGGGLVKVGTTRGSVAKRARTHGITILATEPGSYTREKELHDRFAHAKEHGEWFRPDVWLMAHIAGLPDQYVNGKPVQPRQHQSEAA